MAGIQTEKTPKAAGEMSTQQGVLQGRVPVFMVMAGAATISFSAVFVKLARVTPTVAGVYRMAIGGAVLALLLICKKEPVFRDKKRLFIQGMCGFLIATDLFLWHMCIHIVGPGLATILTNFQALFLACFGFLFLKERISFRLVLALPLAFLGLYLLVGVNWGLLGANYLAGLAMGLFAAVAYAAFLLLLRGLQAVPNRLSAMADLVWICLVCTLFLAAAAVLKRESFAPPDVQTALSLLAYGLFSQVIGWILISRGLPGVRASLAGLLLLLQPSLAFLWDILFFHRPVTALNLCGAVLALGAIYLGSYKK